MCSDISVTHSVGPQPGGYPFTGKSNTGKPAWGTSQAGLMSPLAQLAKNPVLTRRRGFEPHQWQFFIGKKLLWAAFHKKKGLDTQSIPGRDKRGQSSISGE